MKKVLLKRVQTLTIYLLFCATFSRTIVKESLHQVACFMTCLNQEYKWRFNPRQCCRGVSRSCLLKYQNSEFSYLKKMYAKWKKKKQRENIGYNKPNKCMSVWAICIYKCWVWLLTKSENQRDWRRPQNVNVSLRLSRSCCHSVMYAVLLILHCWKQLKLKKKKYSVKIYV